MLVGLILYIVIKLFLPLLFVWIMLNLDTNFILLHSLQIAETKVDPLHIEAASLNIKIILSCVLDLEENLLIIQEWIQLF